VLSTSSLGLPLTAGEDGGAMAVNFYSPSRAMLCWMECQASDESHGKNDEGLMPDSTMENVMTKNTSCAPRTNRTKRVKYILGTLRNSDVKRIMMSNADVHYELLYSL
jgi:hypothetical protein